MDGLMAMPERSARRREDDVRGEGKSAGTVEAKEATETAEAKKLREYKEGLAALRREIAELLRPTSVSAPVAAVAEPLMGYAPREYGDSFVSEVSTTPRDEKLGCESITRALDASLETIGSSTAKDVNLQIRENIETRSKKFTGKVTIAAVNDLLSDGDGSQEKNKQIVLSVLKATANLAKMRISEVDRFEDKDKFYARVGGRASYRKLLMQASKAINGIRTKRRP